ncbi:hypothetical protein BV20DRAFT_580718 [Pilatotrama ljubarskyi]|nr:hypothetical protein BV20DRAFT_580718 [Pilatotrama ljubarskyi]
MTSVIATRGDSVEELFASARDCVFQLQAHALQNASATVSKLLDELLVEVFAHLQVVKDHLSWHRVLLVCRRWFVVGSTAARLWRRLAVKSSTAPLYLGLVRSKAAEVDFETSDTMDGPIFLESLFIAAPHAYRLRTLLLEIPSSCLPALADLVKDAMPALQDFQAYTEPPYSTEHRPNLLLDVSPQRFPKLQVLRVSGIHVFSHSALFSQLTAVQVTSYAGRQSELELNTLLEALRAARDIEEFRLYKVYVNDLQIARPADPCMAKVTLQKLYKISLDTDALLIRHILATVNIPVTAEVCLRPDNSAKNLRAALPEDLSCLPVLSYVIDAEVTMTSHWRSLSGYPDEDVVLPAARKWPGARTTGIEWQFLVDQHDLEVDDLIEDLLHIFSNARLKSLWICAEPESIDRVINWRSLFMAYPTLQELYFECPRPTLRDIRHHVQLEADYSGRCKLSARIIFEALDPGQACADEDSGERPGEVVCPHLEIMQIDGVDGRSSLELLQTIVKCLRNRQVKLSTADSLWRLKELVINAGNHGDSYEEVKNAFERSLKQLVESSVYSNYYDTAYLALGEGR